VIAVGVGEYADDVDFGHGREFSEVEGREGAGRWDREPLSPSPFPR
jgi:hypothetical protein